MLLSAFKISKLEPTVSLKLQKQCRLVGAELSALTLREVAINRIMTIVEVMGVQTTLQWLLIYDSFMHNYIFRCEISVMHRIIINQSQLSV